MTASVVNLQERRARKLRREDQKFEFELAILGGWQQLDREWRSDIAEECLSRFLDAIREARAERGARRTEVGGSEEGCDGADG